MQLNEIKKILNMMKNNDLAEFEMEDGDFRIYIKRQADGTLMPQVMTQPPVVLSAPAAVPQAAGAPVAIAQEAVPPAGGASELPSITAPIVGTFYRASTPEAEPLASLGQEVEPDTVVCIVEAMKVMNEIKAEVRGIIRKVLVENATPVEYGQPLFEIEPL